MVVGTNPWHSSEHDHIHDNQGDDTPREDDRRRVHRDMVLEGADDEEEEPGDTSSGAAGVDTTNVLDEAGKEDAPPEGSPLHIDVSMMLWVFDDGLRTFWKSLTRGQ